MQTGRESRKLLERIEIRYLHDHRNPQKQFKFSASQKYIEICTDLARNYEESFHLQDLLTAFDLVVKPANSAINYLKASKDADRLDVFFLKIIEFFDTAVGRFSDSLEKAHCARLMCIDAHKLRLLCAEKRDKDAIDFALEYVFNLAKHFPGDGRFWFQAAIIKFTFAPDNPELDTFKSLEPFCRALLAHDNPIDIKSASIFVETRCKVNFKATLLNLALSDFKDFAEKDIQTWSFVSYFESFCSNSDQIFSQSDLASIILFISAFYRVSKNSFHFRAFFEAFICTKNRSMTEFWPFAVLCLLKISQAFPECFLLSDALLFKMFQLLKLEASVILSPSSSLILSRNYKSFFSGTVLAESPSLFKAYNFDEEFSIERDNVINEIAEFFHHESGQFKNYITMRSDRTIRLGPHFCDRDSDIESGGDVGKKPETNPPQNSTDDLAGIEDSIDILRVKLAALHSLSPKHEQDPLNYSKFSFILDTNVILSGSAVIRSELSSHPHKFIIPLIVVLELIKLINTSEKYEKASEAWDFLRPLILDHNDDPDSSVRVFTDFGRQMTAAEVVDKLGLYEFMWIRCISNDDQIIETANKIHLQNPDFPKPVLITEDLNMRLKARSRQVKSISIKEFRKLCNC